MLSARTQRAVVLVAALAGALLTARLGLWQLDRAAQKQALQQAMIGRAALPPLSASELAPDARQAEAQHWRRIRLQGRWRPEATLYLDNRQMHGRPGFFVLTPLLLPAGDAVLVQRGWIPRHAYAREQLAPVDTPAGVVRIEGRIAPALARLYEFDAAASGPIRQNLDVADYARETAVALLPLVVVQLDGAATAKDGLRRQWAPAAPDVSKHYGYAVQWFSLSALITGLYVWFQLIRPRRQRAR